MSALLVGEPPKSSPAFHKASERFNAVLFSPFLFINLNMPLTLFLLVSQTPPGSVIPPALKGSLTDVFTKEFILGRKLAISLGPKTVGKTAPVISDKILAPACDGYASSARVAMLVAPIAAAPSNAKVEYGWALEVFPYPVNIRSTAAVRRVPKGTGFLPFFVNGENMEYFSLSSLSTPGVFKSFFVSFPPARNFSIIFSAFVRIFLANVPPPRSTVGGIYNFGITYGVKAANVFPPS